MGDGMMLSLDGLLLSSMVPLAIGTALDVYLVARIILRVYSIDRSRLRLTAGWQQPCLADHQVRATTPPPGAVYPRP